MKVDSPKSIYEVLKEVVEYLDESDKKKLIDLLMAINKFKNKYKKFEFEYYPIDKKTNSLYRFGWFEFNHELYFIYSWNFRKGQVTFMNQDETQKVVFSIEEGDFIKNKDALFISWFDRIKKKIRYKLKNFLKELSEKL